MHAAGGAPEIIFHEGQYCQAALLASLEGIQIAKLRFLKEAAAAVFGFDKPEDRALWQVVEGDVANGFTTST